jgi:hypothetical protein
MSACVVAGTGSQGAQEHHRLPENVVYLSATMQEMEVKIGSISVSIFHSIVHVMYCTELLNALIIGVLE